MDLFDNYPYRSELSTSCEWFFGTKLWSGLLYTPKASQAELESEGNSFIYDPLASEKGFANRFKVVEPIKGVAKHMAYLTDLREKNRAKLDSLECLSLCF